MTMNSARPTAVVVGSGGTLGAALVQKLALEEFGVIAVSRTKASQLWSESEFIEFKSCDARDEMQVENCFAEIEKESGGIDLVIFNIGCYNHGRVVDVSAEELTEMWRRGCLAGFNVAKAAAKRMTVRRRGTIIFSGATASVRGKQSHSAFAIPKFGLRALAQSLMREMGAAGIHIVHVILDGEIGLSPGLPPNLIAERYLDLYFQSPACWVNELDLRNSGESF